MQAGTKERWHVGKEIPLAVVFAMMLQLAGIVWFASKMDSQIDVHTASIARNEKSIGEAEVKIDELYTAISEQNVINVRLEVTMLNINKTLESINRKIEVGDRR